MFSSGGGEKLFATVWGVEPVKYQELWLKFATLLLLCPAAAKALYKPVENNCFAGLCWENNTC